MVTNTGIRVEEAVTAIIAHYRSSGHGAEYAKKLGQIIGIFQRYCAAKGVVWLEEAMILAFMKERYGLQPGTATKKSEPRRAMYLLLGYLQGEQIYLKPLTARKIPPQFAVQATRVLDELILFPNKTIDERTKMWYNKRG